MEDDVKQLQFKDGSYNCDDILYFNTNIGRIKMTAKDALEIAYTLVDSVSLPYEILYPVEDKVIKD